KIENPNFKKRYEVFAETLQTFSKVEEKLRYVIDFMESTLSTQQHAPHFKSFWDARAIALQLFKENVSAQERLALWERYSNLSKESRRLKALFDEQGAFASEQIEIAVQALEGELQNSAETLAKMPSIDFLETS